MKIVVLDGYTLNPGDIGWEDLYQTGSTVVYDRTPFNTGEIVGRIGDAEIVLTNKTPVTGDVIRNAPAIKYIGVLATGFNVVDVDAASEKGIVVTNVPAYSTDSVAQLTFALLLELCHHAGSHSDSVKEGKWSRSADFCFWEHELIELAGKSFGIIGFGAIGKRVARIADAFGMNVFAYDKMIPAETGSLKVKFIGLNQLLRESDIISLHCPLTPETKGIINRNSISEMKHGVLIINTARGPLIVEEDLKEALDSGKVAGAAVDVVSVEPVTANNPLLSAGNIIITPHIAWAPKAARRRLMSAAVQNIRAFLAGHPINVVN